jgi:hypothetical protein
MTRLTHHHHRPSTLIRSRSPTTSTRPRSRYVDNEAYRPWIPSPSACISSCFRDPKSPSGVACPGLNKSLPCHYWPCLVLVMRNISGVLLLELATCLAARSPRYPSILQNHTQPASHRVCLWCRSSVESIDAEMLECLDWTYLCQSNVRHCKQHHSTTQQFYIVRSLDQSFRAYCHSFESHHKQNCCVHSKLQHDNSSPNSKFTASPSS